MQYPVVILTLNNLALSKEAVRSVLGQTVPVDLLILDQGSTDGTLQWARQLAATNRAVRFIAPRLDSVSAAWNYAAAYFFRTGATEFLSINNDVELLPETYETLSSWAAADDGRTTGMVTCVSRRDRSELAYERPFTSRFSPDFSCFLIQRWAWDRVGGFDEKCLIAFTEDSMFHVMAHRKGIRCECISLPFLHHGSQTVKRADLHEQRRIGKQADKNREYFFQKWGKRIGTEGYDELFTPATFGVE